MFRVIRKLWGEPDPALGMGRRALVKVGDTIDLERARELGLVDDDGAVDGDYLEPADGKRVQTVAPGAATGDPEPAGDGGDYPQHRGGGNWLLSDGSTFRGKKDDAQAAEAALHASDDEDAGDGDQED